MDSIIKWDNRAPDLRVWESICKEVITDQSSGSTEEVNS